jgi:hypothetical protein
VQSHPGKRPEEPTAESVRLPFVTAESSGAVRLPDYFIPWWSELEINSVTANLTYVAWRIRGPQGAARFRAAVEDATARHEVLASRIVERAGGLYLESSGQRRTPELAARDGAAIDRLIWAPLALGAVFRSFVIEIAATDAVCGFVVHHGAVDYYGSQIVAAQIRDQLVGEPVEAGRVWPQYRDFIAAMSSWVTGPEAQRRLQYWRQSMRDAPETCLPVTARIEPSSLVALHRVEFELPPALREGLASAARACRSTLGLILMATNHIVLAAALKQQDVIATVLVSGRDAPELLDLVGNTADCFPLRARVDPDALFPAFVRQIQQTFWLGCRNRVKWELVLQVMHEVDASAIAPTFNFIIDPEASARPPTADRRASELTVQRIWAERPEEFGSAGFHPSHDTNLFDTGHRIHVELKYVPARHDRRTIEAFADRFSKALTAVARDPFVSVAALIRI